MWPPPGCRPIRGSGCRSGPRGAARRTSQREREVAARRRRRGRSPRRTSGSGAAADAEEPLVDRRAAPGSPPPWSLIRPRLLDVGAGAERGRRAGDDERADVVVGLELVDGGDDLVDELGGQRVAPVGVVEGRATRDARRGGSTCERHGLSRARRRGSGGRTSRRPARSGTSGWLSPTAPLEPHACGERVDRAGGRVAVAEAGPLEPAVVDAAAVAQQGRASRAGGRRPACRRSGSAAKFVSTGGSGTRRLPTMRARPRSTGRRRRRPRCRRPGTS